MFFFPFFLLSISLLMRFTTSLTCPSFTSTDVRDYALDNQRLRDGHNLLYALFGDDDYFMKNIENIAQMYKIDHKISVKCYSFNKISDFHDQNIKEFINNAGGSRIMLLYTGLDSVDSENVSTLNELLKFTDTTTSYSNVINVVYWNISNKMVPLDSKIDKVKDFIGDYINNITENMNGKSIAGRIHGVAIQNCTDGDDNKGMDTIQVNKSMNVDSFCRSFDDARDKHEKLYENLYILAIVTGVIIVLSIIHTLYLLSHEDNNTKKINESTSNVGANNYESADNKTIDSAGTVDSPNKHSSKESTPEKRNNRRTARSPIRQRVVTTKKVENKKTTDSNEKSNRMKTRSQGKKST